ncbi:hypothetical protein AACH06_29585 [Ideonella sp. DXS29W]|uniref:Uncharacterized protein n=1 Tax=Ideonella lacteola TaxID=2984193 RepID=A0ABU9BYD0_9BURK
MNQPQGILFAVGRIVKIATALVAAIAVLWAIAYRLILGFTPLWLDMITVGAGAAGMLVLWLLSRGKPFDYSAPIKMNPDQTDSRQ